MKLIKITTSSLFSYVVTCTYYIQYYLVIKISMLLEKDNAVEYLGIISDYMLKFKYYIYHVNYVSKNIIL